jgi:hypothetical protein
LEGFGLGDQEFQFLVALGQGFRSFRQVKGRSWGCRGHVCSILETGE